MLIQICYKLQEKQVQFEQAIDYRDIVTTLKMDVQSITLLEILLIIPMDTFEIATSVQPSLPMMNTLTLLR